MTYQEALAYLDSFVNLERNAMTKATRAVITLDRVRELAERLGNPQNKYPTLHVAGTKGKGSTCAFTQSILSAAGLKVGLYVSPHLQDVRERITINAKMIPESEFARVLEKCKPDVEQMRHPPQGQRRPTYFEVLTHMAFAWFADEKVDVAIFEVGLGGRLDATNIITPVACGITNISFDHQAILGDTLEQIATEKAGIFKPGVPIVSAPQTAEVLRALEDCAKKVVGGARSPRDLSCPLEVLGREIEIIREDSARSELPTAKVRLPHGAEYQAQLGLRGNHQIENWAVAVRLADLFYRSKFGTPIPAAAVKHGAKNVAWPGRLEEITAALKDKTTRVFLDGAHNDHSLRTVLNEMRAIAAPEKLTVLFACAKDKDATAMLKVLAEFSPGAVIFTHSGNARGREPEELAAEWKRISGRDAKTFLSCADGLSVAQKNGAVVLVTGSLYLVGAIKDETSKH